MNVSQEFLKVAKKSKSVSSALEDYELLAALLSGFTLGKNKNSTKDDIFSPITTEPNDVRALFRVSEYCGGVWTAREGVDWLIFYIFYRRFGWDESAAQQLSFSVYVPSVSQRSRPASKDDEQRFKERIVAVSADLISWLEQNPLFLSILKTYNSAIRIARSTNVTRQHIIMHTLRWVASSLEAASGGTQSSRNSFHGRSLSITMGQQSSSPFLPPDATPENMYMAVMELIILSTTDSLSTVRNAVVPMVGRLLQQLSLNTCLRLMDSFIEIFNRQEVTSWEAAEGYLNVMGLLVKRIVFRGPDDESDQSASQIAGLPVFNMMTPDVFQKDLLPRIKVLVFNLFDHAHPSVRIGAVYLYITCLKRCPNAVIQTALNEIMNEVCVLPNPNETGLDADLSSSLGSNAIESLLSLCQILLRYLFSLTNRSGGIRLPPSTGELQNSLVQTYLGHPELNVRIAACQVYETLIFSSLNNPNRVRYLLTRVMENWNIKQDLLLAPLYKIPYMTKNPIGYTAFSPGNASNWYEGRLRIYGSVCRMLVQKHLTIVCDTLIRTSDSDSGLSVQDEAFNESPRMTGNTASVQTRRSTPSSKRSALYEKCHAAEIRAALNQMDDGYNSRRSSGPLISTDSTISQQSPRSLIGSRIHLPLMAKRNSNAMMSILDRFRSLDECEKNKVTDTSRTSVWRNEIAKRLSIAPNKAHSKSSTGSTADGEPTRMRVLFANILHASIECLVAEPRDLRQCARKAFPEVGRLFRWFDATLFMEFLAMHLVQPPTLMSYACLKMLRASLEEFTHYERRFFSPGEQSLSELLNQTRVGTHSKVRQSANYIPDAHFLNCAQIRCLFSADRSALWLRSCQQYLIEDATPTFICLPALDCVLRTLSFVHHLQQFSYAVQWTEASNPNQMQCVGLFGEKANNCNLVIDQSALLDAIRAVIAYVRRFEIILDERHQPSSMTGEHQRLGCLRPYCSRRALDNYGSNGSQIPLATFLMHVVSTMEGIIFYYLPPASTVSKPDLADRYAAGQLLSPMLIALVTWPLALLPPLATVSSTPYSDKYEPRVLAVRRLLRLIAAIVHALPLANDQLAATANKTNDQNNLSALVDRNWGDLTGLINSYFAKLENVLQQLHAACSPIQLCHSTSWWWFRALCEHMPRLMQIAPHANPVGLIRQLLDEASKSNERGLDSLSNANPRLKSISPLVRIRWKRAIDYARNVAAVRLSKRETKSTFAYRWPTVSVLLRSRMNSESATTDMKLRETATTDLNRRSLSSYPPAVDDDDSVFDGSPDGDAKQSAFDQMTDDEPDLLIEPVEGDTSSGEEHQIEFESEGRIHHRGGGSSRSRGRTTNSTTIKAQAIETPPPFTDVVGLIKRTWPFCQPVTIGILRTLLSSNELQIIIAGQVDAGRQLKRTPTYRL